MKLNKAPLESNRFDMNIHRGNLNSIDVKDIKKYIIDNCVDVLMIRIPSANKYEHEKLAKVGFDYLHADNLVYYSKNLLSSDIQKLRNDLQFEIVTPETKYEFEKIIPIIFKNYQNHYFSNPYLSKEKILKGYTEWAQNYNNNENKIAWYVKKNGQLVGFATCSFDPEKLECYGILYGVMPDSAGQGIYSDIMRFTQKYFKKNGYKKMFVSTQIQNYSVQKVWIREGFFLTHSYDTYHINAMLNYSINDSKLFKFIVKERELNEFAQFSGDYNSIHFDANYAKNLGLKDRIIHGMIVQSKLSKIFGVDYPGKGTLFLSNNNIFIAPIYLDLEYSIIITTIKNNGKGLIQVLAKVFDSDNNLCLLSYNNLIKR